MSTEDSGTPRAIIYTRVAREQDSPETSEAQREAIQRLAEEHGYEVVPPAQSAKEYAATHSIACMHADDDGIGSHILAPGEKCDRGAAER